MKAKKKKGKEKGKRIDTGGFEDTPAKNSFRSKAM